MAQHVITTQARLFISYSSTNRELARSLHALLMQPPLTYRVWRDEHEIERDWSAEIANALVASEAVVLLWSSAAAESRWVLNEWLTARALQKPIFAIFVEGAPDLPLPLQNLQGMPSSNGTINPEILQTRLSAHLSNPVQYDYTIRSTGVFIPFRTNPSFVGRGSDFARLYLALIGNLNKTGISVVGLVGMAGVGKTQLVVEFIYRYSFAFESIHWVTATDEKSWVAPFINLAREILQTVKEIPALPASDREWMEFLRTYCSAHPKMLVIIDNVNIPEQLNNTATLGGITPLELGCNILFTTRVRFNLPGVTLHALDTLSEKESFLILSSRRKPESKEENEEAQAICSALGFLPLALVLAASYLGRYLNISFHFYLQKLKENRLESIDIQKLDSAQLATRHIAAVGVTLNSQWEKLNDSNAKQLMTLASQMNEGESIPKRRLALFSGIKQSADSLIQPLEEAILVIEDLNLAEGLDDGKSVYIHPLIRELVIKKSDNPALIRSDAADRLDGSYQSAKLLEEEYAARGLGSVLQDFAIAIAWSEKSDTQNNLKLLRRVLDAESKTIYRFSHNVYPAYFLQQIYTRAFTMGLKPFAKEARDNLLKKGFTFFELIWRTNKSSGDLIRTIVEESHWVNDVICTTDGRILTANESGSIGIWELETGRKIGNLKGHTKGVRHIYLLKKQNRLLSFGDDDNHSLWDLKNYQQLPQPSLPAGIGTELMIDEEGERIVTVGEGNNIFIIETDSFTIVKKIALPVSSSASAMMPDGIHLLVAHSSSLPYDYERRSKIEHMLSCWNLDTDNLEWSHPTDQFPINDIVVARDGALIATTEPDGKMNIWNTKPWKLIKSVAIPNKGAFKIVNKGSVAVIGSMFDLLLVNLENGEILHRYKGHSGIIKGIDTSADGGMFVTGGCDGTARVWDIKPDKKNRKVNKRHEGSISSALILKELSVTGDMKGKLMLWENKGGKLKGEYEHWMGPRQKAITADGGKMIISSSAELEGGTILALNLQTGIEKTIWSTGGRVEFLAVNKKEDMLFIHGGADEVRIDLINIKNTDWSDFRGADKYLGALKPPKSMNWLDGAALTADGNFLLMSASEAFGSASSVFLFDVAKKAILFGTAGTREPVQQLALKDGGEICAFISTSGSLSLWYPFDGNKMQLLAKDLGRDPKLTITQDNQFFITAGTELCVWDIQSKTLLHRLTGHPGVWHLVILNEKELLTASEDWTVTLWDFIAGKEIATVGLDSEAREISVSADGTLMLVGDGAGDIYMFRVQR